MGHIALQGALYIQTFAFLGEAYVPVLLPPSCITDRSSLPLQAAVSFTDVAALFSEGEWDVLEQRQRDLYGNVMRDIHHVLLGLGGRLKPGDFLSTTNQIIFFVFQPSIRYLKGDSTFWCVKDIVI